MADPEARIVISASDRTAAAFRAADRNLKTLASSVRQTRSMFAAFGVTLSARMFTRWIADALEAEKLTHQQTLAIREASEAVKELQKVFGDWTRMVATGLAPSLAAAAEGWRQFLAPTGVEKLQKELRGVYTNIERIKSAMDTAEGDSDKGALWNLFFGSGNNVGQLQLELETAQRLARDILGQIKNAYLSAQPPPAPSLGGMKRIGDVYDIYSGLKRPTTTIGDVLGLSEQDLRRAQQLTQSMRTELEVQLDQWREATDLFGRGGISGETLTRFRDSLLEPIEVTVERMKELDDQFDEMKAMWDDFGESLGHGLQSALADAFLGIGDNFSDMLRRMAAEAASSMLLKSLASLGGPAGSAFSFLGFGGARAAGGPVSSGKAYLVGERGPEMFVPGRSGAIVPGGAPQFTIIINNETGSQVAATEARETGPGLYEIGLTLVQSAIGSGKLDPLMRAKYGLQPTLGMR